MGVFDGVKQMAQRVIEPTGKTFGNKKRSKGLSAVKSAVAAVDGRSVRHTDPNSEESSGKGLLATVARLRRKAY